MWSQNVTADISSIELKKAGIEFYRPAPILCTDNGAMIACAAYYAPNTRRAGSDLNAFANISIENIDGMFNKGAN